MYWRYTLITLCLVVCVPRLTYALLPPDVIFNVGSQFVQMFSVVALVVTGLVTSIVIVGRQWFFLSLQHAWKIFVGGFLIVMVAVGYIYYDQQQTVSGASTEQLTQLKALNSALRSELEQRVPIEEYQRLLSAYEASSEYIPGFDPQSSSSQSVSRAHFTSDTITLYTDQLDEPFVLEIDLNRREDISGLYSQYTFLNGSWMGEAFSDYQLVYGSSTLPRPNDFMPVFNRTRAYDLSTRDSYDFELVVQGEIMSVSIHDIEGDFLTRNHPAYTRYQSAATALVKYRGQSFTAQALVESAYSDDYTKYIFFPEYSEVDATTHQFILWDDEGNLYMIDKSEVRSNTPAYPSHNWLLYKNARTGALKKSFSLELDSEGDQYIIEIYDFDQARIRLTQTTDFKNNDNERIRALVSGTIIDNSGVRTVSGVLHLVR